MTQNELNRAVAAATGETIKTIAEMGFVPLASVPVEREPLVVDPKGGPNLEQVDRILKAAKEPRRTQYAMLAFTGMRSAEMQHLLRVDVDLKGNWVHIISRHGAETKTRESRKVPIHPRLRTLLEARKKTSHTWFFTAGPSNKFPHGGHWVNPKRLNEDFLKNLRSLGIPAGRKKDGFTIHSLRHFFKTFCINTGIPKPAVDTWQGHHGDHSASAYYYRLSDSDSQKLMLKVPFGTGTPTADVGNS